jgi:hypothetical protein
MVFLVGVVVLRPLLGRVVCGDETRLLVPVIVMSLYLLGL